MIEILDKTKKKKIIKQLEKFGIKKLDYLLIKTGREKIRGYTGSLSVEEINKLRKILYIESIGIKLFNIKENNIRISFDAISIPQIKEQIKNNIININNKQLDSWMRGRNIEISEKRGGADGFVILKYKDDFVGMGKKVKNSVLNYVPKERRLKN